MIGDSVILYRLRSRFIAVRPCLKSKAMEQRNAAKRRGREQRQGRCVIYGAAASLSSLSVWPCINGNPAKTSPSHRARRRSVLQNDRFQAGEQVKKTHGVAEMKYSLVTFRSGSRMTTTTYVTRNRSDDAPAHAIFKHVIKFCTNLAPSTFCRPIMGYVIAINP